MSICKNYYVIAGYDLTDFKTDKYDDWEWTDEGQEYTCNQIKGRIQLFNDPMCGEYLYLGYILAAGDQYDFETIKFSVADIEEQISHVTKHVFDLIDIGVISDEIIPIVIKFKYDIIAFEECT